MKEDYGSDIVGTCCSWLVANRGLSPVFCARIGNRAACYRIEKRGTPEIAGEGAGKSAAKIRGAGGSAGERAAPHSFPRKAPIRSTLASTSSSTPNFSQHSSRHPPQLFSGVPLFSILYQAARFPMQEVFFFGLVWAQGVEEAVRNSRLGKAYDLLRIRNSRMGKDDEHVQLVW